MVDPVVQRSNSGNLEPRQDRRVGSIDSMKPTKVPCLQIGSNLSIAHINMRRTSLVRKQASLTRGMSCQASRLGCTRAMQTWSTSCIFTFASETHMHLDKNDARRCTCMCPYRKTPQVSVHRWAEATANRRSSLDIEFQTSPSPSSRSNDRSLIVH